MFRPSIPALLAVALVGAVLWLATRVEPQARALAPLAPARERASRPAEAVQLAHGKKARAVIRSDAEDELESAAPEPSFEFVEEPGPGEYTGPWARGNYPSGKPRFECQQVQREDGVWVLDGDWTAWHESGRVLERGRYRLHEQQGLWEWWDDLGRPIARGSFVDGEREGPWTYWYEDGTQWMDAYYARGRAEGRWAYYHENGRKRAEGSLVDGEASGFWSVWDEQGVLDRERTGQYEHGERVGD